MTDWPILSTVTFLPLVGVFFILLVRGDEQQIAANSRHVALWTSVVTFALSILLVADFDTSTAEFQFVELVPWLPEHNIGYHLGVDGISIFFLILTTFLIPICILASWEAIATRVREFMIAFLIMETLIVGVFCSLDLVMFYIFFEGQLIPMFLIIGIWGGARRVYSAFKFFLYTLVGSVLFLLAILFMYLDAGTTDIPTLLVHDFAPAVQTWLWLALFASFAVKLPMWPFHTWLPDAHVEAPTAGSVILAGILLKMGGYGFLRFSLPMLPDASAFFVPFIYSLSIVAIIYTSLVALMQQDMKKLIAYSSVAHMGIVTIGIFTFTGQGIEGGIIQMLSHGIVSAALFLCVGDGLRPHPHPRDRGLWRAGAPHADLRLRAHGVHAGRNRAAGDQRLRRRIHGAGGRLPVEHLGRHAGADRRGSWRRLHALALPARDLRRTHQGEPQVDYRPQLARSGHLRATGFAGTGARALSGALPGRPPRLGREPDRTDERCAAVADCRA